MFIFIYCFMESATKKFIVSAGIVYVFNIKLYSYFMTNPPKQSFFLIFLMCFCLPAITAWLFNRFDATERKKEKKNEEILQQESLKQEAIEAPQT